MQTLLHHGIPSENHYRSVLKSDGFKEMESFSNSFLQANQTNLGKYAKRWVRDPLHQWSRQWEYPYVFGQIETILNNRNTARILDAGSGVTFFPYYIRSKYLFADVYCTDYDKNLGNVYQQINDIQTYKVSFSSHDLKELPYADNWFDLIYCISVLEHTDDYRSIIDEFHRILCPGGSLAITFDISLDGTRDISIEKANILLRLLAEKFTFPESVPLDIKADLPNTFTTISARNMNPALLPWKLPVFMYQIQSWMHGKKLASWPPLLSVFCLTAIKTDPRKI